MDEQRTLCLEGAYIVYVDCDIADEETQKWVADEIKRQGKEESVELIYWRSSDGPAPPSRNIPQWT